MADLDSIRDGLKTRLATISGLRAHDTVPGAVHPPAAVVGGPTGAEYDLTMGGGARWEIPVRVYVGKASERTGQDKLDNYINDTGATSIKAAIEGDLTLGGTVDTCRVARAQNYGVFSVAGTDYLGVEFVVEVWTS